MSAKHTPGPWTHAPKEVLGNSVLAGNLLICLLCGSGEESDANGRLIAAAPELLEALKKVEEALKKDSRGKTITGDSVEYHLDGQEMYHAINLVRAAIARAEGSQQ